MSTISVGDSSSVHTDIEALVHSVIDSALLQRLDGLLASATIVEDCRMTQIGSHLVAAGGKRLRPRLVVTCAVAVAGPEGVSARVMKAAAAIELFHLASLYHDDVLDDAELRRGWRSANSLWGNERAVLGGDVLLSHAYRIAAELGPKALRRLAETSLAVCRGQIAECDQRFDQARSIPDYEQSIRGKTAALLSTACWLGATTARAPAATAEILGCYGSEIGLAFQIFDDVLDLCATSHAVGKTTGSDLRAGVFTLPVLLSVIRDPSLADLLLPRIDERAIAEVTQRVRAIGGDRGAIDCAVGHIQAATAYLAELEMEPAGKRALTRIAESVINPQGLLGLDDPLVAMDATPTEGGDAA